MDDSRGTMAEGKRNDGKEKYVEEIICSFRIIYSRKRRKEEGGEGGGRREEGEEGGLLTNKLITVF